MDGEIKVTDSLNGKIRKLLQDGIFKGQYRRKKLTNISDERPSFTQVDIDNITPFFDVDFYLTQYPDVAAAGIDPVEHYLSKGWIERRDPSRYFSTGYYLDTYLDIVQNGLNPLIHYAIAGRKEGRRPKAGGLVALAFNETPKTVTGHIAAIANLNKAPATYQPTGAPNPNSLSIHWVIPDFGKGGGGHMTIFRMIRLLESFGHECTIWIFKKEVHLDSSDAYDDIVKHYQCLKAQVNITDDGLIAAEGDAIVATSWQTAYPASRANGFRKKFYFVQDHEPEFYATGVENIFARLSYQEDLACICAGKWLMHLMSERYGRWARSFDLGYDHDIYTPKKLSAIENKTIKIAVYAREATARRCVNLALIALEKLGNKTQEFEVHFFGQEQLPFSEVNYQAFNHGILDAVGLAALYNSCDIGICFSGTNYSLVPQEMMACGLPLIELDGESTRAIFPEDIVTLAGPDPDRIMAQIYELMSSPSRRRTQAAAALEWVKESTWEKAARCVESAILERLELTKPVLEIRSQETTLDIVIPTFNGIDEIKRVINALRQQTIYSKMAIYCVDSSSTDGTTEWLKEQSDISTTVIPQQDFQHGRTRNFGASLGCSQYIAFLTQDATPANDSWAYDIIVMMEHYISAGGLFGRHLPYEVHTPYVQDEVNASFDAMLNFPLLLSKDTKREDWGLSEENWRQLLHYYSDNNSCMRRSVWEKIPYPEIDFGEDQVWANTMIQAGYSKIYAPTAAVYHSHDFGPQETYKRCLIESQFFYEHFKYEMAPLSRSQLGEVIRREHQAFQQLLPRYNLTPEEVSRRLEIISERHRGWFDGLKKARLRHK